MCILFFCNTGLYLHFPPLSTWLSLRSHWDSMHMYLTLVEMEARSPSARDTTGGARSTLSTTPLTLIPIFSLVGWQFSFNFCFSVVFRKIGHQPCYLLSDRIFWAPKEMTVLVSHCVAAPHMSRAALQPCPTFNRWKQLISTKTQHCMLRM